MGQVSGVRREVEEALTRRDWQSVQTYCRNGIRPDELRALAGVYNSETLRFPSEHFRNILTCCPGDQIESVFQEIVKLCLWRSVGAFLKLGVKDHLRKWAVSQALSRGADTEDLADILPYCTDDQFDESFSVAVNKGIWRAVDILLKRQNTLWLWIGWGPEKRVSAELRQLALKAAICRADDDDMSTLLLSCADQRDMRDECLKGAVIRGLWVSAVKNIIESFTRPQEQIRRGEFWGFVSDLFSSVPHYDDSREWALKQAAKRADERVLLDYLPLFRAHCMVKPVLRELVKRSLWRAASELLLLNVGRDSADTNATNQTLKECANTNQTPQEDASVNPQPTSRFDGDDDRVDFILKEAVGRGMWGVVKLILKQSSLADEQVLWVTGKATEIAGIGPVSRSGTAGPHVPKADQLQFLLSLLELNTDAYNGRKMTG